MSNSDAPYERFTAAARELADIAHAESLLHWDQETCMPRRGSGPRARSLGTLAGLAHERLTAPDLVELVAALDGEGLSGDARINVRELKRHQDRALRIPRELVVELRRTESLAHEAWVEARQQSEFGRFQPWLEKIVDLKRQEAHAVGFTGSVYNALLDHFEPHARVEEVEPLLGELRRRLVPLVEEILGSEAAAKKDDLLERDYDVAVQESFGRRVLADLGFDMEAGRLDVSVHPFCSGSHPGDVRLTTRYNAGQLTSALFGIIHEAGHGLYEQGLPAEAEGLPVGGSVSLGIHESQSRTWENAVGRSREFWEHYLPHLARCFPAQLEGVDVDRFYAAVNRVERSLIRVEADEMTYDLHILLRFELEKALMEGELEVGDLPGVWNERMQSYLGIRPGSDAEGVLQDIHWSLGLIGYFPTYTLGNLYGAQFYRRACADLGDLPGQIRRGVLSGLLGWVRENIHSRGSRLTASELVQEVTGEPLRVDYLMEYLEGKYRPLYGLA